MLRSSQSADRFKHYALSPASISCHWSEPGSSREPIRTLHKTGKVSGMCKQDIIIIICIATLILF